MTRAAKHPTAGALTRIVNFERCLMNKFGLFVASLVSLLVGIADAKDYKAGAIEIDSPWSRAIPKGASVAAGYMTIKNTGTAVDRLVSASTPVAGKVEIHQMTMENGVMKMRPVAGGLEIAPGATVELKPESFHLMIMNVKQPIEKGKPFGATLTFEKAGTVDVEFAVEGIGAVSPSENGMPGMPNMHH
jgi:periplasmic copper chaperone A